MRFQPWWPYGFRLARRCVGGIEDNVAINTDIEPVSGWYFDRGLDVQIPPGDLNAELRNLTTHRSRDDFARAGCSENRTRPVLRQLEAGAEQAC